MSLFKIPERTEQDIHNILAKAREEQEYRPKLKVKGSTLLGQLSIIAENVKNNLGEEKDNYLCITKDTDFITYVNQAIKDGIIAIDTETMGLEYKEQGQLVGICLQSLNQKPAYIPYGHISAIIEKPVVEQVSKETLIEGLKIIHNSNAKLIWHNAYYDLVVLYLFSGLWFWVDWDTMIAGWLLNENEPHGLKELYDKYVMGGSAGVHKFNELFEGIPFCYIPYNIGYIYGAHDAEMTLALYQFQKPFLTKGTKECEEYDLEQSADILTTMELPLVVHLCKMRVNGINIDNEKARELKEKYEALKKKAKEKFNEVIKTVKPAIDHYNSIHSDSLPYPPNFNSPPQMAVLFYDILSVGIIDKKKPRSVGADIMDAIITSPKYENHPAIVIAKALAEVKTFDKLLGSFIDKLPTIANEYGGKIHIGLNQIGTNTGRFSSSNPRHSWAIVA